MRPQDIRVGTSGWKFADWAGAFYPLRVPQTKWLEYYAARFSVGEINSTYYRIAPLSVYDAMARKTPVEFRMTAKVHAEVTHVRQQPRESMRQLLECLKPLRESGKLIGLLAQFPSGFRYSPDSMDYVRRLRDFCGDVPLCVEFRNESWLSDGVFEPMRADALTWVCPDEPALKGLLPRKLIVTAGLLYLRLHGRNAAAWYNARAGDRYDYEYSENELTEIGRELLAFESTAEYSIVMFNNCHAGKAPRNAWWLKSWLAASSAGQEKIETNGFDLSTD